MVAKPISTTRTLLHFSDGSLAYAGRHHHHGSHQMHTHSFIEIVLRTAGAGVHQSPAGRHRLEPGDAILLRPGVRHGYQDCDHLEVYNCCFTTRLLQNELAWTRDDPLLGRLLWTGRRGLLTVRLGPDGLDECLNHLDDLAGIWWRPPRTHRAEIIGRLTMFLGCLARAGAPGSPVSDVPAHPAVREAVRMMEARPAHVWTLAELAAGQHLTRGYLVRLFKEATGLPPMAYLSRHRIEMAAAALLNTDDSVNRIAESVGFPDQNYFARRFRAQYGFSASAYRTLFAVGRARR